MGTQYNFKCKACEISGDAYDGAGESAIAESYFCKSCSQTTTIWQDFNFESIEEADPDVESKAIECNSCQSKEIVKMIFVPKMVCPNCKSKKFKFTIHADWD